MKEDAKCKMFLILQHFMLSLSYISPDIYLLDFTPLYNSSSFTERLSLNRTHKTFIIFSFSNTTIFSLYVHMYPISHALLVSCWRFQWDPSSVCKGFALCQWDSLAEPISF